MKLAVLRSTLGAGPNAGAGLLDDALESALQLGEPEDFSATESYVTIMKALTGTDPSDTASFTKALQAMEDNEAPTK
ncbi:hypothetical protein Hypma_012643 [Hypsizygus marmoreus]|uniref:Uncharacterized protein n=1 Tax=Hypsizygus marmoreus TaxID=39966 RepID=A0A369JLE0_HYPMA|nr:hypothetical protein Hypma_012643 [Hypsizygus marmoreus]